MRRLAFASLLACLTLPAIGCGGDEDSPLFVDLQWQVRCRLSGGCVNIPARDIFSLDRQDGHRLSCSVNSLPDGSRVLTFSAWQGSEYGVDIRGAQFPAGGGAVGGTGCRVTVGEGGNTFEGACTSATPSAAFPCQLSAIAINPDGPDGPEISGGLYCEGLPSTADSAIQREVTRAGNEADAVMMPAVYRIVSCAGI